MKGLTERITEKAEKELGVSRGHIVEYDVPYDQDYDISYTVKYDVGP